MLCSHSSVSNPRDKQEREADSIDKLVSQPIAGLLGSPGASQGQRTSIGSSWSNIRSYTASVLTVSVRVRLIGVPSAVANREQTKARKPNLPSTTHTFIRNLLLVHANH